VLREDLHLTGAKYGLRRRSMPRLHRSARWQKCSFLPDLNRRSQRDVRPHDRRDAQDEKLHPVQEAFLSAGAFQCGYCTPGMIMGVVGLLKEKTQSSEAEVLSRMQKHLCRCCSYPRILKAVRAGIGKAGLAK